MGYHHRQAGLWAGLFFPLLQLHGASAAAHVPIMSDGTCTVGQIFNNRARAAIFQSYGALKNEQPSGRCAQPSAVSDHALSLDLFATCLLPYIRFHIF